MTKEEFLRDLEEKLTGEVNQEVVFQNVSYYRDYIDSSIRQGRTEEEVLEELGSPFLIAKTIIDTSEIEETDSFGNTYEERGEGGERGESWSRQWTLDQKKTKWLIIGGLILVAVLFFTVLRLLLPILIPIILVIFLWNLFRKK